MNEDLNLLDDLGRAPLPAADELAPARARLVAAIRREPVRRPVAWWRRPLLTAGLTTGVAAAVAAAVLLAPDQQGADRPLGQPPTASGQPVTEPSTQPATAGPATAAEVLHRAAVAAIAQPFVEPRPDQFVYLETLLPDGTRRDWLSVDGTRDGLYAEMGSDPGLPEPGCVGGERTIRTQAGGAAVEPCEPMPAFLPDAPTEPAAMLAYIEAMGGHPGVNSMAKNVLALASQHYLRPQARAALYEAATAIPDIVVVPDATDGAGRPGIGVGWTYTGSQIVMVFDPTTYAYLGIQGGDALVSMTIVDAVGQRP